MYPNVSHCHLPIDFSLRYHVFGVEWNASALSWFVDDVHVFTRTHGQPSSLFLPPAPMYMPRLPALKMCHNLRRYLILNTAVAWWFKLPPSWTNDVFFRIDWVRIYEREKFTEFTD